MDGTNNFMARRWCVHEHDKMVGGDSRGAREPQVGAESGARNPATGAKELPPTARLPRARRRPSNRLPLAPPPGTGGGAGRAAGGPGRRGLSWPRACATRFRPDRARRGLGGPPVRGRRPGRGGCGATCATRLPARLRRRLSAFGLCGQVLVAEGDSILLEQASGIADRTGRVVDLHTCFAVGSITRASPARWRSASRVSGLCDSTRRCRATSVGCPGQARYHVASTAHPHVGTADGRGGRRRRGHARRGRGKILGRRWSPRRVGASRIRTPASSCWPR